MTRSAAARRDESALRLMPIPEDLRGGWQVEADFIAAIRGERPVTQTDFATGRPLHAVHRGRRAQLAAPAARDAAPERVLQPEPLRKGRGNLGNSDARFLGEAT